VVVRVDEGGQHDEARIVEHDGAGAAPGGEQVAGAVRPRRRGDPAAADRERGHRADVGRGGVVGHRVHSARDDNEVGGLVAHVRSRGSSRLSGSQHHPRPPGSTASLNPPCGCYGTGRYRTLTAAP